MSASAPVIATAKAPVLAVDDHPANLIAIRALAGDLNIDFCDASSCEEAVELASKRVFAVILLDVMMPGADGFETLLRLRKLPTAKATPVLFMTARDFDHAMMERAYTLGAVDYMTKPLNASAVHGKLRAFIALYHQEQEIRRQADALAAKDEHIAVLAHDIRNPLGAVKIGADLLETYQDPAVREVAARIRRAAIRMERLTADVLLFAQHAARGLEPRRTPGDLGALCTELTSDLQATHPEVKLDLHVEGHCVGSYDPDRLQQAVANLLSNAIKFGTGWVSIRASCTDTLLSIEVTNDGTPIQAACAAVLFDKFERGGDSRPGTGLGLFIARLIARAHGGDLTFQSGPARTTFTMQFPR